MYRVVVVNCVTGESVVPDMQMGNQSLVTTGLVRHQASGRLLAGVTAISRSTDAPGRPSAQSPIESATVMLKDAVTWETLCESNVPEARAARPSRQFIVGKTFPSPDGFHTGLVRVAEKEAEIWNLRQERCIVTAPGSQIVFSPDGRRAAIIQTENLRAASALDGRSLIRASRISVWDVISGQAQCEISLSGDSADLVRFSPDGRRLLTLHGHLSLGAAGSVAQGRLRDVESGREILAMPVADLNVYDWDLVFDGSGLRLTSLLFGKFGGTGGGGNSVTYDATPLSPEEDAQLVSRKLIDTLSRETPLPSEMQAEIAARRGLSPLVRKAALAEVERMGLNAKRVAEACLDIVCNRVDSPDKFQNALRWAQSLYAAQPESLRSRSLLGAAQYRGGQFQQATVTLADSPATDTAPMSEDANAYELLRVSTLLLAKQQAGASREELLLLDKQCRAAMGRFKASSWSFPIARIFNETRLNTQDLSNSRLWSAEEIAGWFTSLDKDGDGKLTESDSFWSSSSSWSAYQPFDRNGDDGLSLEEYTVTQQVVRLMSIANPENRTPVSQLANLNEAIRLVPEYASAFRSRAWLLATSPDDSLRNGAQAVADATRANELTGWKYATYLDTLAAAQAEAGNFEEAVKRQEEALALATITNYAAIQARLAHYKDKKSYREAPTSATAAPGFIITDRNYSAPLLAPDQVLRARRITGWGSAWSPDGKKLVRNVNIKDRENSNLEVIDLESGETTTLCVGGADPGWSRKPGGPIAFTRVPAGKSGNMALQELWLVEPDGSNQRKLAGGGSAHWSDDNRLFFRTTAVDKSLLLSAISPDRPDERLLNSPLGAAGYPAVSRDGTMVVCVVPGRLSVYRLEPQAPQAELLSLPLAAKEMGLADFSPDGRFVAYGSWDTNFPGVWLIEVATGRRRMLASIAGTMPRWSPDGRFIAVDQRTINDIVLLDVSGLDLRSGLPVAPQSVSLGTPLHHGANVAPSNAEQ